MVWTVLCVHFYFVQEFPCLKWIFFSQSGVGKPTYDPSMWLWLIKNFGYILNSHTSMEKQGKPFSYALGNAVILNFSCQNQNWKNTHSLTTYQIKIAPVSNVWMLKIDVWANSQLHFGTESVPFPPWSCSPPPLKWELCCNVCYLEVFSGPFVSTSTPPHPLHKEINLILLTLTVACS